MTRVGLTGNVDQLSDCICCVYRAELLNGKGEADWNRSRLMASGPSESVRGVQSREMGNYQTAELQISRDRDDKYPLDMEIVYLCINSRLFMMNLSIFILIINIRYEYKFYLYKYKYLYLYLF